MTNAEYRKESLGECSNCAQDCKGSADYAAYAFGKDNEADGRRYVKKLEENLSRLKGAMRGLDRYNEKIAKDGPDSEP